MSAAAPVFLRAQGSNSKIAIRWVGTGSCGDYQELSMNLQGNDSKAVEAHITNFLDAVRGKGHVIAPPSVGQQAAISGHMVTLSFKAGKKIVWDENGVKVPFCMN